MKRQRNMFQIKEQDKSSEKEINKMEVINPPDKEYKPIVIRMLTDLQRRMDELSETFNKELENMKKNQSEMKKTILEMKKSLEGLNKRVEDAEEQISKLDERLEEITQVEQIKDKRMKKNRLV